MASAEQSGPESSTLPTTYAHGAAGESHDASRSEGDHASSVDEHVAAKTPPVTKKQKFKRHCGKWWWAYLIGNIIFLAILLPIIFELVVPAIVQDVVNDQKLPVLGGALQATDPDHIGLSLLTQLNTPLPATIDPVTLQLHTVNDTDHPFGQITLPKSHAHHKTNVSVENQPTFIQNQTGLVDWFNQYFVQDEVELFVRADPKVDVHLGVLESKHHLSKTVKMPGLGYLPEFRLIDMQLMIPPDKDGYNVKGSLNLPNNGVLVLGLGNLGFNIMSGDINLGLVHLKDVTLQLGNNSWPFIGNLYFDKLIPNLATILDQQKEALNNGYLELGTTGNSTVVAGKHITYLEKVLNTKRLTFQVPVITLISDLISAVSGSGNRTASLFDILGDVFGNSTLIQNILNNFNHTLHDGSDSSSKKKKRGSDAAGLLALHTLRMGMRSKFGLL